MKRRGFIAMLAGLLATPVLAGTKPKKAVPRETLLTGEVGRVEGVTFVESPQYQYGDKDFTMEFWYRPGPNGSVIEHSRILRRRDQRWEDFWDSQLDPLNDALRLQGRLP